MTACCNGYGQWTAHNIATNHAVTSVDFVSNDVGYVIEGKNIHKTENGGNTWLHVYSGNDGVFYEDLFAIDRDIIVAVGKDFVTRQSVITKTENGGLDWYDVVQANSALLLSVFFISTKIGFCSGADGTILKTLDSGENWQKLKSGTLSSLKSIFFVNEMEGIAVGGIPGESIILKTIDGGMNWTTINSPSNNYLQSVFFTNKNIGYIVGWNGEIMKTENGGWEWKIQNSVSMSGNLEVTFTDDNIGYIVGGSTNSALIQKTTNGGEVWRDISPPSPNGLLGICFPSENIGYAVGANGTVLKTETGGMISSVRDVSIKHAFSVYPNPVNRILNIKNSANFEIESTQIYDSNGKKVTEFKSNPLQNSVDLSNLMPGIYYLEIQSNQNNEKHKIIKI